MHYYQHNINDFNNATIHLSEIEECMYHRALAWYYSNEKPLPRDKEKTYRFLRAKTAALKKAVDMVLEDFFTLEDDGYHQSRCDEEIAAYHNKAETARENGSKGGRPKANDKLIESDAKANQNLQETQDKPKINPEITHKKANQEPLTNNHKPLTNGFKTHTRDESNPDTSPQTNPNETQRQTESEPTFDDFWDLYDKKVDRPKCEKRWNNLTGKDRQAIMIALPAYKIATPDKQYRKDPATYLNARAWENEIIQSPTTQAAAKSKPNLNVNAAWDALPRNDQPLPPDTPEVELPSWMV